MHAGMLQVANEESGKNEKMSKSLNNFVLLHEALEQVKPNVLRMLVLQTHYRSPLVFGEKRLTEAEAALNRIENAINNIDWKIQNTSDDSKVDSEKIDEACKVAKENFIEAMDDDFNTSKALAEIFELVGQIYTLVGEDAVDAKTAKSLSAARDILAELLGVFGIEFSENKEENSEALVEIAKKLDIEPGSDAAQAILDVRSEARKNKDFELADKIRDTLQAEGFTIEDTPSGPRLI